MEIKEMRELSIPELEQELNLQSQKLFELRRKKAVGQLEHGEEVRATRKEIAKLETIRREHQLQIKR